MRRFSPRTLATTGLITAATAGALAFGIPAALASTPAPTPTYTHTPAPTPVVSPFAHCQFTTTNSQTWDPAQRRFIYREDPAIVCGGPRGAVKVYDLLVNG